MSTTTQPGPGIAAGTDTDARLDDEQLHREVALAIAHSRGAGAQLRPDDDIAAVAAVNTLRQLGVVLTPAVRHMVHAALLHSLAAAQPRRLDLWEPDQIVVGNWLRDLALDEEHTAAEALHTGATPMAVPRRRSN